ncbi:hypothetical protein BS78_09G041000 [Paspalum vaginatum]|nr:hypothetical protein BS78_09G041000 [Paspalum vaginatum]
MCPVNSCNINYILRETKYFQTLAKTQENILTIAERDATIVGTGRATIVVRMSTQIAIKDALLHRDSTRTLVNYRDIHKNGFHVKIYLDNNEEFLLITKHCRYGKETLEEVPSLLSRLYCTCIKLVPHIASKVIF